MKTKERKATPKIDHRGINPYLIKRYNLELELVNNINKKTPSYSFDEQD